MATYNKANNTTDLNQTGSWATTTVPTSTDIGQWESTVTGSNSSALGADLSWLGLIVANPGGNVTVTGANILTIGTSGIDLSSATRNITFTCNNTFTNSTKSLTVPTGRIIQMDGAVIFNGGTNTLTGAGTIKTTNNGSTFAIGNSVATTMTCTSLSYFDATLSAFNIGMGTTGVSSSMNLGSGSTTSITATTMGLGASGSSVACTGTLRLGETNTINCNTITIGQKRSTGTINFNTGLTAPTLTLRGTSGGSNYVTTMTLGEYNTTNTTQSRTGTFNVGDYSGAVVDALITTLYMGSLAYGGSSSAAANPTGVFTLNGSSSDVTITSAYVGVVRVNVNPGTASKGTGTLTLTNGSLTVGTLRLADQGTNGVNSGTNNTVEGYLVINGGTLTVNTAFVLADQNWTGMASTNAYASLIINGGTVSANCNMTTDPSHDDTATYPTKTILTLTTGTLDMNGYNIGTAGAHIGGGTGSLVSWQGGTLSNVGTINDADGLEKTTSGSLTLTGANAWTGVTTITLGTLSISDIADGGTACNIGAATNSAGNIVFNGGDLTYTGSGHSTDRLITVTDNGGDIYSSGTGALVFTNAGSMAFTGTAITHLLVLRGAYATNTFTPIVPDMAGATTNINKRGVGGWTLAASASTYTGVTNIYAGILSAAVLANGGSNSSIGAATNAAANLVIDGASFYFVGTTNTSTDRLFTVVAGTTATIKNQAASVAGLTFSNTGSIAYSGTGSPVTLQCGGLWNTSFAPLISDVSGSVTNVTKIDYNIWYLTNSSNSYTGITTINAGFFTLSNLADGGSNSQIGASTNAAANLIFNGGSIYYAGGPTVSTDRLFTIGTGGGSLYAEGSINFTFSNGGAIVCSGTGDRAFNINGSGSVIYIYCVFADPAAGGKLSISTGEGGTRVSLANHTFTGSLRFGATYAITTLQNGGIASPLGQSTNAAANLQFGFSGATFQWLGVTGAGSTDRLFTIYSDQFMTYQKIDASGAAGSPLTFSNTGAITWGADPGLAILPFRFGGTNTDYNTFAPALSDYNGTTRKLSVEKVDVGTWILTGTNTYTSTTTVTTGSLFIDGSTAAGSAVSVASGATLGGIGTIAGPVTLSSGAIFYAGSQFVGHLNTGALTYNAGSFFYSFFYTPDKTYGCITSSGAVVCDGYFSVAGVSGSPAVGDTYVLIAAGSVTGTFIDKPDGTVWTEFGRNWRINYTAITVVLTDVALLSDIFGFTDSTSADVFWTTSS
jgi:fibronectin-binding autotransporter adhesin